MKIYICLGLATMCDARPPRTGLQTRRAGLRSGSVVRPKFMESNSPNNNNNNNNNNNKLA